MSLLIAAMAQAVASAPPEKIDLTIGRPCAANKPEGQEIVVCGRRDGELNPYRINKPLGRDLGLPKAQLKLGGGVAASAETESADVGGFPSNRAMVRLKIKF